MEPFMDYGSYSSDSGVGQDLLVRTVSLEQTQENEGIKLPVKHVTPSGTQRGTLLERYHLHNHSKSIICQDCGIFFTCDSFLSHSHDNHGRKRHRPPADFLELDILNPDTEQTKAWEKFLAKMGRTPRSFQSNFESAKSHTGNSAVTRRHSPVRTLETLNDKKVKRESTDLSNFDKSVQETVNASERLLRETSQYLQTSGEKLKHRRQRSLRNYQLRPKAPSSCEPVNDDSLSSGSSSNYQPVIKYQLSTTTNSKRPNRKFLEKYLEKSCNSFELLTDSLSSLKPSALNSVSAPHSQQELSTLGEKDHGDRVIKDIQTTPLEEHVGGGGDAVLDNLPHGSTIYTSHGNSTQGKSVVLQEHCDKNDPLFIIHTAQELLNLAAHKMQEKPQKSLDDIDWEKKYEAEKELSKEKDRKIKELEGQLLAEQKKRQNAEIQLRAKRLQNL